MAEDDSIYFTYPADGTRKTVGIGRMIIDLYEGKVKLPDGSEEKLSDSLKSHKMEYARSLAIECDQIVKYGLDTGGLKPNGAANIQTETYQKFRRIVIETTTNTQVNVWASTNPAATISIMKR